MTRREILNEILKALRSFGPNWEVEIFDLETLEWSETPRGVYTKNAPGVRFSCQSIEETADRYGYDVEEVTRYLNTYGFSKREIDELSFQIYRKFRGAECTCQEPVKL